MNLRKFLLLSFAVTALYFQATPARAQSYGPFFYQETFLGYDSGGNAVFYLPYFGYYTYLGSTPYSTPYPGYLYKYGFGFLYSYGNSGGGAADVYLYDFGQRDSLGYLYTSANYGSDARNYLYLYSFTVGGGDFLVYFQDTYNPRQFYDYDTGTYFDAY